MENLLEGKTEKQIITEIHNEFDSAAENILKQVNEILQTDEVTGKLKEIGFISIQRVKEKEQRQRNKRIKETVTYYQQKYPFNKFIQTTTTETICKKYNLMCGSIEQYTGSLPDKNIDEILSFKLFDEDRPETDNRTWFGSSWGNDAFGNFFLSEGSWCEEKEPENSRNKITLRICAPSSDFDKQSMQIKDGYLLVNDPIVLQPVKGGYLIVSKWGLEGEDKDLVNEKLN